MIEINYFATGGYIQYFDLFAETLINFFPGEKKILRVVTDGDFYVDYINDEIVKIDVIKTFDLVYPCINLNKTYFLSQLPKTECKYVFYFDADTFFNPMPMEFWCDFKKKMDDNFFCIGKHPYYSLSDDDEYKERDIEIFFSSMTERDETQGSFIDSYYYTYVISSFFCAKNEVFNEICETVTDMIRNDMTRNNGYKIPLYMDENYFNKLVYNFEFKNDTNFKFDVKEYILLGNSINKTNTPYAFITQKNFNKDFKINRR